VHQPLDHGRLLLRQHNIARWHGVPPC
jgi:hypothetical protein